MTTLFEKRHFDWLAGHWNARLREASDEPMFDNIESELLHMTRTLRMTNPSFKPIRFMQACGYTRKKAEQLLERL